MFAKDTARIHEAPVNGLQAPFNYGKVGQKGASEKVRGERIAAQMLQRVIAGLK